MRIDRLTSKLQLALSDAQSVAVGHDHPAIEPVHLLQALLEQQGQTDGLRPKLPQPVFQNLSDATTEEIFGLCPPL